MGPSYRTIYQAKQQQQQEPADLEVRVLSPRNGLFGANFQSTRRRRPHTRRVTKWIIAAILALCLAAYFLSVSYRLKVLHAQQLALQHGQPIDVVAVSLKPSCVTRQAVAALNAHLRPRTIHIVTTGTEKCVLFRGFAPNVACHLQDGFLPGLTLDRVGDYLQHRLGVDQHKHFKGRELAGWYMQQLVKLGSVLALPDLSQYYVVWDLDMVLLAPVQLLWCAHGNEHELLLLTQGKGGDRGGGGDGEAAAEDAIATEGGGRGGAGGAEGAGSQFQTLVNIGGSISPGYIASFRRLFRRDLEFAPDGSSFVTHWMVIYRPYLLEFLAELAAGGGSSDGGGGDSDVVFGGSGGGNDDGGSDLGWVWRILSAVDPHNADLGFSEYASYISWVRQHHPASQRLAPRKTWVRHPFGQATVRLLRHLRADGCCCPSGALLRLVRALGFVYTGYEVGHIAECRYDAPRHVTSYGL